MVKFVKQKCPRLKNFFLLRAAHLFIALWILWTTIARASKTSLIHSCGQFIGKPGLLFPEISCRKKFFRQSTICHEKNFKRQIICELVKRMMTSGQILEARTKSKPTTKADE